jgi:hypothetical protein
MEFPSVPPAVITRLAPLGLGINRRMGDKTGFSIVSCARRCLWRAARCCPRLPPVHPAPTVGSDRPNSVRNSRSDRASAPAGPASGVPRCGARETVRARRSAWPRMVCLWGDRKEIALDLRRGYTTDTQKKLPGSQKWPAQHAKACHYRCHQIC